MLKSILSCEYFWLVGTNNIYHFPINADQPTISKNLNRVKTYQESEIEEKIEGCKKV